MMMSVGTESTDTSEQHLLSFMYVLVSCPDCTMLQLCTSTPLQHCQDKDLLLECHVNALKNPCSRAGSLSCCSCQLHQASSLLE